MPHLDPSVSSRGIPPALQAEADLVLMTETLMNTRQTVLPKRLIAPGPNPGQMELLLRAAASAPDHGQLRPWRFVQVPQGARIQLADAFGRALRERDPDSTEDQVRQAQEKAFRAPLLLLVVVDGCCGDPEVDLSERLVSTGCAVQNMLLMATAMGFGSALTSGKALKSGPLRELFGLQSCEHALCFASFGSVISARPGRIRPQPTDFFSVLEPGPLTVRTPHHRIHHGNIEF